jgi:NADH-quinone oxidoreductase subunit J
MEQVAFYVFATVALAGGLLMVTRRNPLDGAFALVFSLAALAGLFAMLHAEFVFILQILLYAGAIMVLIIFTIMLLNLTPRELKERRVGPVRLALTVALCAVGAALFVRGFRDLPPAAASLSEGFGTVETVGRTMLRQGTMVFPFEVISLLLLVAILGVVILAKREI